MQIKDILLLLLLAMASVQAQDCATIKRQDVMQVWAIRQKAALCSLNPGPQSDYQALFLKVEDSLYFRFDSYSWIKLERSWKTASSSEEEGFKVFMPNQRSPVEIIFEKALENLSYNTTSRQIDDTGFGKSKYTYFMKAGEIYIKEGQSS